MRHAGRLLLMSLLLTLIPAAARAVDGGAWTVVRGEWYSEIRADRTWSNQQFLLDGRDQTLPGDVRIHSRSVVSYNEIGWKKHTSVVLALPFRSETRLDGPSHLSVSGLSDLILGLRFQLRRETPALLFEVGWKAPLGYEKELTPSLGNGRQEALGAINIGLPLPIIRGFAQASRGLRFIGQDGILVSTTSAEAASWLGPWLLVGARYRDATRFSSPQGETLAGGSYAAGPIVLVRVDDAIDLSAGSFHDLAGRGSLRHDDYYVAVSFKQSKLNRLQGFLGTTRRP